MTARIITFVNQKGGVGKTTTAVNVAAAAGRRGRRVLLVDLDPQANASSAAGVVDAGEPGIYEMLMEDEEPTACVVELPAESMSMVPSSPALAGAEVELVPVMARERRLVHALSALRGSYDLILIDCPPSLGLLTINAFVAATGVIVPVQCEYLSLRGLVQLENTLGMVRENLNPRVSVEGIVATMFDGRTLHAREAIEILEENFGDLVYKTRIRKTVRYAEAPVKGSSVLKYDPTGSAAEAYRDLAKEIHAKELARAEGAGDGA